MDNSDNKNQETDSFPKEMEMEFQRKTLLTLFSFPNTNSYDNISFGSKNESINFSKCGRFW